VVEFDGRRRYSSARRLLICADGGGSNSRRNRAWKPNLLELAEEIGIPITVSHYPPGTSKWNRVEHRVFSFISLTWKGKPLWNLETVINLIGATRTRSGLHAKAVLDTARYETGVKISDEQIDKQRIRRSPISSRVELHHIAPRSKIPNVHLIIALRLNQLCNIPGIATATGASCATTVGAPNLRLYRSILMSGLRILLADDNSEILATIREELAEEFEIIGTVSNGQDAVEAALRFDPDVVVLDIAMPILDGIQVSSRIHERNERTKILFLTIQEHNEYVSAAFAAGASGYVTKRRLLTDLGYAIREVAEGRTFLSPSLTR
jgi:CheY-like chemotaxis protein